MNLIEPQLLGILEVTELRDCRIKFA